MSIPSVTRIIGRVAGTKGVPRAEREQLILDAATEEFGRYGFAGAALSAIAVRADVSKPMVLSYFGSKEGLYVACVERAGNNLIDRIEEVLAAGRSPLPTAGDTLATIFAGLAARPHDWNVINDRTVPPDGAARAAASRIRGVIAGQASRGVARVAQVRGLTDADDLSALTDIWMSSVTAMVNWWLRHPDRAADEMAARSARILAAITAGGGESTAAR